MTVTNVTPPVISGSAVQGQRLATSNGTWTSSNPLTFTYEWLRCDAGGASCVAISGAVGANYLIQAADVGSTLRSEVTATENAPSGGDLLWTPPGYPSYAGYTTINITNVNASGGANGSTTGCRRNLSAGQDYIVVMPNTPITQNGGVYLNGGRNIVIIGGEIFDSTVTQPGDPTWMQIGLYLTNVTGTVHIEGMYIHGPGCGDGIDIGNGCQNATIHVQNTRINNMNPTVNPPGSHPDSLQTWCGPDFFGCYQCTFISSGTIRTFQPNEFATTPIGSTHFERQNWVAQQNQPTPATYALWDNKGTPAWWPEYHDDIWFYTDPNHPRASTHSIYRDGDCLTCFNPPGYGPITGSNINFGMRPTGDWVVNPASDPTACGTGYVSPGYQ